MKILSHYVSCPKLDKKITSFIMIILSIAMMIFSIVICGFLEKDLINDHMREIKMNMAMDMETI